MSVRNWAKSDPFSHSENKLNAKGFCKRKLPASVRRAAHNQPPVWQQTDSLAFVAVPQFLRNRGAVSLVEKVNTSEPESRPHRMGKDGNRIRRVRSHPHSRVWQTHHVAAGNPLTATPHPPRVIISRYHGDDVWAFHWVFLWNRALRSEVRPALASSEQKDSLLFG